MRSTNVHASSTVSATHNYDAPSKDTKGTLNWQIWGECQLKSDSFSCCFTREHSTFFVGRGRNHSAREVRHHFSNNTATLCTDFKNFLCQYSYYLKALKWCFSCTTASKQLTLAGTQNCLLFICILAPSLKLLQRKT